MVRGIADLFSNRYLPDGQGLCIRPAESLESLRSVSYTHLSRPFNKEEWAAQKKAQREEAYALVDATCSEMMTDGRAFQQYLDVQGRFDRYSVNNAILVAAQMPEATQLKDYGSWKQSRVYVDKDADKITILEPGKEYKRDDGSKAVGYNAKVCLLYTSRCV